MTCNLHFHRSHATFTFYSICHRFPTTTTLNVTVIITIANFIIIDRLV
jgi:hypothetical protein